MPHGWELYRDEVEKTGLEERNSRLLIDASLHNWVMANQRMAAALRAEGYHYWYDFAKAAGHTDGKVTRQTLSGALEWLWQGYSQP